MTNLKHLLASLCLSLLAISITVAPVSAAERYQRSIEHYRVPDVELVNQYGDKVRLPELLEGDETVVLDFIYGTCTTICPVLSAGFVALQKKLEKEGRRPRLISITIDPENDTPKVMRDYLKRYRARPGWDFLTGSRADIDSTMTAFDAYIPDKMSHYPLNMIRDSKTGDWVRLFGLMSSREFLAEYKKVADR